MTMLFDLTLPCIAHYAGKLLIKPHCVAPACSPEFAFARFITKIDNFPIEPSADIWAFGTAPFHIVSGYPLFNTHTGLPYVMVKMAGYVPSTWKNWYDNLSYPPDLFPGAADNCGSGGSPVSIASTPTLPMLTPDDFYFQSKGMEDIIRYVPGGYHPIILEDILDGQYRIMTDESEAFVVVKVTTAESDVVHEVSMLRAVSSLHISTILDHFTLSGPNGTHSVLITDVVAPFLSVLSSTRFSRWRKSAAYGLAQAVMDLHTEGIVHADLRLGNVGLTIPQLAIKTHGACKTSRHTTLTLFYLYVLPTRPRPYLLTSLREMARVNCGDDNDADGLISLMRKVFVLDPEERITAEQVVGNPWFADVDTLELPA
ncbi:hypothetical protein M422DRAFT_276846 [Sphaerobolus stellatus SS14]|uniref:non-specific serine/threonine protein kinase n=1 Tax=Sphaerobolus stellatus (strain SS14) TaxID=990650 RepID=A0A0C9TLD7_SPHS4|nr:hypothetical protein M422DRAFT_276846 [Sphaerobolus stellatus SS14]